MCNQKKYNHQLLIMAVVLLAQLNLACKQKSNSIDNDQQSDTPVVERYDIERVEPPNWWVGFKSTKLQLLVKHPGISSYNPEISYPGVSIKEVHQADSPNYLFIDLELDETTKAGTFNLVFKKDTKESLLYSYELKARTKDADSYMGFDSSDAIYLITPDRFANGNSENDVVEGLLEQDLDRAHDYKRHGGDIKGIANHLDYINDLGFTAIWPCPLLTNDMPNSSYHGYAITDYYAIDPRFGSLDDYLKLSTQMSEKGMKLVMDQVVNHCGSKHWWMQDLPFKDWLNQQEAYENHNTLEVSSHRRTANQDLYASNIDKAALTEGWFVPAMPDLNQKNPFMANYLIQNSIWWIETAHLGGIRQDTYPYPDKAFLSRWAKAIMTEYPNFSIVGEEWSINPLLIAYWQAGHENKDGYQSYLPSSMDFAMQETIVNGLNEMESTWSGLFKLYEGLANDFAYKSPKDILIFPDNHDMSRIFTRLNGHVIHTKMALSYILVLPRIPQIYYGTEILMNDFEKPGDHGLIRTDFPGGWAGDAINAFTGTGLSKEQLEMQAFLKAVLQYRKTSKAIHEGETVHFAPENGIYVLFRIYKDEVLAHIMNRNESEVSLNLKRFEELGLEGKQFRNILTNKTFIWGDSIILNESGSILLTTKQ
ncbi:glycoside hydrolase family 13 protein [Gaetbulibacter saemankumensis]|uniref:glycoside hydrolase family 13 protein n=1 Tax=Gaetbulibacter saemankumensis TaxID=311208 RepID=UPI000413B8D6|nr:glycoside hydrolase family 13 protein [Gaetbulibacter saemankumensis]